MKKSSIPFPLFLFIRLLTKWGGNDFEKAGAEGSSAMTSLSKDLMTCLKPSPKKTTIKKFILAVKERHTREREKKSAFWNKSIKFFSASQNFSY